MLEIDGSYGEGGGQILRTALSLSCLTGQSFRIFNIRRNRKKPGLMPQHLAAVRAVQVVSSATVEGDRPHSTVLDFTPSKVRGGVYSFDIGTAGSVSLVLQTLIPPLLRADRPSRITLGGGTHVPTSPSITYLKQVFAPMLQHLNARVRLTIDAYGFYPRGGGRVMAEITPLPDLPAFNPDAPCESVRITGTSAVCKLPLSIAERQRTAALSTLSGTSGEEFHTAEIETIEISGPGPGTFLFLRADRDTFRAGFTALGARGKPAETVGSEAATELIRHLGTGALIDPHLADQLIIYLALSHSESCFTTSRITSHLLTNLWVVGRFLPIRFNLVGEEGQAGRVISQS